MLNYREFNQKRLDILENKELRIKNMKIKLENEFNESLETEKKRMLKEHEKKLKFN
jgi:hypothetical protein